MQCEVVSKYFSAADSLFDRRRQARDYGLGEPLHQSEVNFIEAIHRHPHSNAMELSQRLNVTRGAITQMGNRLEAKGIVMRFAEKNNKKEKYYALTKAGDAIVDGYERYHSQANERMCKYLLSLNERDRNVILEFLETVSLLPINEFKCAFSRCPGNVGDDERGDKHAGAQKYQL